MKVAKILKCRRRSAAGVRAIDSEEPEVTPPAQGPGEAKGSRKSRAGVLQRAFRRWAGGDHHQAHPESETSLGLGCRLCLAASSQGAGKMWPPHPRARAWARRAAACPA